MPFNEGGSIARSLADRQVRHHAPPTEGALTWLSGLGRPHHQHRIWVANYLDLLRNLINDTEPDVASRTARLRRRRTAVDAEIARLAAGAAFRAR